MQNKVPLFDPFVKAFLFVLLAPFVGLVLLCGGCELWDSRPMQWEIDEAALRVEVECDVPIGTSLEATEAWCRAHRLGFRIVRDVVREPFGDVPRLSALVQDWAKDPNRLAPLNDMLVEIRFGADGRVASRSVRRLLYRRGQLPVGYGESHR